MRAGRSNSARPNRARMAQRRQSMAIPLFGYQNRVSIDRRFGFIRRWAATDAAAYEGRRLRQGLLDKSNTASGVWADTAYRSAANEAFLTKNGFVSHIHRKKPKGRVMPETMRRANNAKSKIRAPVEHVSFPSAATIAASITVLFIDRPCPIRLIGPACFGGRSICGGSSLILDELLPILTPYSETDSMSRISRRA